MIKIGICGFGKAIEEFQPDLFISGHIHEAEGLSEKIGKTNVVNVGKKARLLRFKIINYSLTIFIH